MKRSLAGSAIGCRLRLALVFIMSLSVFMFAFTLDAYAADSEPEDLRWNEYRPYRAEWEWTAADKYPDKVDITEKYESLDGGITDTFTYPNCHYETRNGASYIDFNNDGDERFFDSHGEGYYSFYLDVYYSGQSDPSRVACGEVQYHKIDFDVQITGSTASIYWDVDYSIDQLEDAHYVIPARNPSVLPADKTVRVRTTVHEIGFKADGFDFNPVPGGLSVSDSGEKASFTLDRNVAMTVKIMQEAKTVPVTIDFGEGHEDVAARTAERIKDPGYQYDPSFDASVNGSIVTIPEWPQATKVGNLKTLVSDRIYEAWSTPDFSDVYDDSECFDGKIGRKSIGAYSGEQEYLAEKEADETVDTPDGGLKLYVLWDKQIRKASYTIEAPVCGTEITKVSNAEQSPAPVIEPEEGYLMGIDESTGPLWYKDGSFFSGTIEGGETYTVKFGVKAPFGCYFGAEPDNMEATPTLKINGTQIPGYSGAMFNDFDIQAVHDWSEWTVEKEVTEAEEGVRTCACAACGETKTEAIPKVEPAPTPALGSSPNQKGENGTAVSPGASAVAAEKAITTMRSDTDPKGAVFNKLKLKSPKQTKTSIKLNWAKVEKAKEYVIYGNKCGKTNKPKKLATTTGASKTFKKLAGKKVKKGTYYKFIVVALDKNNEVVSISKLIHVATKGGKVGNDKKVTVKKSVLAKAKKLKKGKTLKLKAKAVAASKKLKVKKHVKVRYESTNPKVAKVSSSGKVTAKKKGTAYVYAYAQNGVYKKVKVKVN